MARLRLNINSQDLSELPRQLRGLASDSEAMRIVMAMALLIKDGDLGFWLSKRLERRVKALSQQPQVNSSQSTREIDEEAFLLFLPQ